MSWPRYGRMAVVFASVLVLALLLQPIVDTVYLNYFYQQGVSSTELPAWIVAIVCLSLYMAGYVFIIGTPRTPPEVGRPQRLYVMITAILIVICLLWLIAQLVTGLSA
jgi:hypothetical protein